MKTYLLSLSLIFGVNCGFAQTYQFNSIPQDLIITPAGDSRSGSCASPDGDITCDQLTGYPDWTYLTNNSCCFSITPPAKNVTYCYEFTAVNTSVTLDAGWSITVFAGYAVWFSNFELYTCTPDCVLVGTGLSYTGLTVGQCYTWCFDTHMSGGGAGGGFNKICPYAIQTPVLPIELLSFDCMPSDDDITLTWITESETDCSAFDIMRSADGINFELIGTLPGNGTTNSQHTYSFVDNKPIPGDNYYQLRQIDNDNSMNIPQTVIVCSADEEIKEIVYYTLSGQRIDFESATTGIYIKETSTTTRQIRQIVYISN